MATGNKSVVVVAPNGRRQTVKVTPNTTILQILEEVCKKQGLIPNEYDLKHHKNILDTTAIIRFSGLPNNAQLEMCAAQKTRQETSVTLGVQLENGERLMGDFTPNDSLFHVLTTICPQELSKDPKNIVVVYMRNEIYGIESLKNTSLRSLGLTGGRAMLRLMHRTLEQLKTQANVSSAIPAKPQEEKPYIRKMVTSPSSDEVSTQTKDEHSKFRKQMEPTDKNKMTELIKQEKVKARKLGSIENKKESVNFSEPMEVEQSKKETKHNSQTKEQRKKQISFPENFTYLGDRNAMAFSLEQSPALPHEDLPDEFFELTIQDAKKLYRDLKTKREELEERPLQTSQLRNLEKEKKLLRQINQYGRAVIRVQFPDRTVLQGTFRPLETIQHVHNFIQEYLEKSDTEFYLYTTPPKTILSVESTLVDCECVPSAVLYFGTNHHISVEHGKFLKEDVFRRFVSPSMASLAATKSITTHKREVAAESRENNIDEINVGASTSKAPNHTSGSNSSNAPQSATYQQPPRQTVAAEEPKSKVPKWFKPNK